MRSYLANFDLVTPENLTDVLNLLSAGVNWRPIAGGTDLMVLFNAGRLPYQKLVNIAKLPELTRIQTTAETVSIGAAVTYSAILRHSLFQSEFPLLCRAASWTGGTANQNRGTLGGNIVNASPAADSPPALLVYDAEVEVVSSRGTRRLPYRTFHTGYKKMDLAPDELVLQIYLPRPKISFHHYSRKVGARKAQAISKVCFNALADCEGPNIRHIRIALGSVAPVPLRCVKVETALEGQRLTPALIAEAREILAAEIQPIDDIRSTASYRTLVSQNLLSEFLGQLQ